MSFSAPRESIIDENIPEEQIQEYRSSFLVFDRNKDGVITSDDLKAVMQSLGENPTEAEVQEIIHEIDLEGKGAINFAEFVSMMERRTATAQDEREDLTATFKVFDKNGDGFVTMQDMQNVLDSFDTPMTIEEIKEIFRTFDIDKDGMLSFEEFSNLMKSSNAIKFPNTESVHKI